MKPSDRDKISSYNVTDIAFIAQDSDEKLIKDEK